MDKFELIEDSVIYVILKNPESFSRYDIEPSWFRKWSDVITACKQIASKGLEIDLLAIHEELKQPSVLQSLNYIMFHGSGVLNNMQGYLDKLQDTKKGEQLKIILDTALNALNKGDKTEDIIHRLMQTTLQSQTARKYAFDMKEALGLFVDKLEEIHEAKDQGGLGLKTGLTYLDETLGGLHPSDMIVVGARPGMGKTAFGLTVLANLAKKGKKVGFISTEMSAHQIMLRLSSRDAQINAKNLRDASLDEKEWSRLTMSVNSLVGLPLRLFDKPNVNTADVALQAKSWMIDGGLDFLVIDYLTRVKPVKTMGNQNQDVGEVVTAFKNIARQLEIPVMVLAQLNRDASGRRPVMSDLRDSGIIEQEADQIVMLYRDEETAEILVEKNRHGESNISIICDFDKETMTWRNHASIS